MWDTYYICIITNNKNGKHPIQVHVSVTIQKNGNGMADNILVEAVQDCTVYKSCLLENISLQINHHQNWPNIYL